MNKRKILVVDDRINTLKVLMAILADDGYEVLQADTSEKALEAFTREGRIDAVLSDLKMPGMDGVELHRKMKELGEAPPFVIMTAYGTIKSAVEALTEGITDYLIKPLDYEELSIVLNRAIREREMSRELMDLHKQARNEEGFHSIIATSGKMKAIFDMIRTVGATDASVLLYGETGTGKELLARALHLESRRRNAEMVCINSAALTETLLEAELFGYVKGAFTGAVSTRRGRLEMADGGTLFLDEIGHMSLRLQTKLLRFLQDMSFQPVGSVESRRVDVRLIAATNLDLQKEIESGQFMSDLLYRIEVISIRVPPLRERREDIPLLVDHYLKRYSRQYEKTIEGLQPEVLDALTNYSWPGNVRELKNSLARAVILSKGPRLALEDFPEKVLNDAQKAPPSSNAGELIGQFPEQGVKIKDMETELIRKTLLKCEGNKSLAAKLLGISRKALYEKMERYGILS